MHRRDSERRLSRLVLLAVMAGMTGCTGLAGPGSPGYPKFSDIPKMATPTTPASQTDAGVASLKATGAELAAQPQGNPTQQADDAQIAAARAVAAKVQAPTDADDAATQAFLRQARARATPPPPRKK
jgi:hypothetical protein